MIPAVAILIFAWSLKGMGDALGIGVFVENLVGTNASASVILPAVMFMIAIFLAFSTGTSWGTFAILVPIVVAMFPGQKNLEMMIISVAAVLAGAVCGDHISPISDTTVMSSAGAQSNHINHVSTQMQMCIRDSFNTAPSAVWTEGLLEGVPQEVCILELASMPGGIDRDAADRLGIHINVLPGLPGRFAPCTSGRLLGEEILKEIERIIKRECKS